MPDTEFNQAEPAVHSGLLTGSARMKFAVILGSLAAFGPLSLDMYLPAFPKLAEQYESPDSVVQLSLTACMIGLSVGQLFAGSISDMRGRRGPLLIGLMLYVVSSIMCALSPTIGALIAFRFIQGLSGAAGIVISRAIVRDLYSGTEMTKFFTLLMLINGAAPILAPIIGGQLLKAAPWPGVFVALAICGVLALLAVAFGLPETLPRERRIGGGLRGTIVTFGGLLRDRSFMGYALAQGFVMAGMFAYIAGSPFVLQNLYGVSPQMFGVFFGVNAIGIITAGQIAGRLAGRVPEKKLFAVGLGMAVTGGAALLAAASAGLGLYAILPPLFVAVASVGLVGTTAFTLAMQNQARAAGSASALIGLLSFVLGGAAAPLVGLGGASALPMGIVIFLCEIAALLSYLLLSARMARKSRKQA